MSDQTKLFKPCAVLILAAGNSQRMESPKFALQYTKNQTFLEKIIQVYTEFGCKEISVVLNKEGKLIADRLELQLKKTQIVLNEHPEWERFYSIKLGMQSLSKQHPVFIHNVDNPFVTRVLLESLISQDISAAYVVPTFDGKGGHPILISKRICQALALEKKNDLILSDFLKAYDQKRLAVNDAHILTNINTKEIYHQLFK